MLVFKDALLFLSLSFSNFTTKLCFTFAEKKLGRLNATKTYNLLIHFSGIDVASACATRKVLLEQLGRVLPSDVDTLPDKVFLVNKNYFQTIKVPNVCVLLFAKTSLSTNVFGCQV
jgi:hypothetical protein